MAVNWQNFFVESLRASTTEGHCRASDLRDIIKNHRGGEAYTCAYDLEPRPDFKDYKGLMRPAFGYVWFDFDSHDGGLQALEDTRAFVKWLKIENVFICYSGSKGFHVGVPFSVFGLEPSENLCEKLLTIAKNLKKTYPSIDTTIYNANRKFRALGSKHPKTNLYKINITRDDLCQLDLHAIKRAALERISLEIPEVPTLPPDSRFQELSQITTNSDGALPLDILKLFPEVDGAEAFKKCSFLKHIKENQAVVSEPDWYAALSIVGRFTDGRKQAHSISNKHPGYSVKNTNEKLDQALSHGPRTCEAIAKTWDGCKTCPLFGQIKSPVSIESPEKKKKPSELEIARTLVKKVEGTMLRQEKNLFRYTEGKWTEQKTTQIDDMKKYIMQMYQGAVTARGVDSTFTTFFRELPHVPEGVNLFDPNPFAVNFQNGTLHIRQSKDHFYTLEFLKHNKDDFLNTILPFDYSPENTEQNIPFMEMLFRILDGDPDSLEKMRAIKQMFGACLIPAFPHLFFLYGPPATGKSTVMKIVSKLMSKENICSVEPSEFHGFNMETMIGKLVNIETDVTTNAPISDAQIKKIIDRLEVRVRRKGIADVYGRLPAIHIFGGNAIPPTLEGSFGAHDRRWTFIEFKNSQASGLYDKEFDSWVFSQSPQGILNFALEGLRDLLEQRGHYLNPESGKAKMKKWQAQGDSVGLFLDAVPANEIFVRETDKNVVLKLDLNGKINRTKLYNAYKEWSDASGYGFKLLYAAQFYDALENKGFRLKGIKGVRYVEGFTLGVSDVAEF